MAAMLRVRLNDKMLELSSPTHRLHVVIWTTIIIIINEEIKVA